MEENQILSIASKVEVWDKWLILYPLKWTFGKVSQTQKRANRHETENSLPKAKNPFIGQCFMVIYWKGRKSVTSLSF